MLWKTSQMELLKQHQPEHIEPMFSKFNCKLSEDNLQRDVDQFLYDLETTEGFQVVQMLVQLENFVEKVINHYTYFHLKTEF